MTPLVKPRLLDLFCGAGGCARGYQGAGFHVTGVDNRPQPNYCGDAFVLADIEAWWSIDVGFINGLDITRDFDAIHASPPCQRYIRSGNTAKHHPDLLPPTREALQALGLPWVIENVPGAPMRPDAILCGSQFGLEVRRHRWFEFSWDEPLLTLACDHSYPVTGVYGNAHGSKGAAPGMLPGDLETWSRAMGIDWMTTAELANAIPPAYTELIGRTLMGQVVTELVA